MKQHFFETKLSYTEMKSIIKILLLYRLKRRNRTEFQLNYPITYFD